MGGYGFDSKGEAFEALKREYISISTQNNALYYAPYLNIYPFTDILTYNSSPPYEANLKATLAIHENLTKLALDYDSNLFTVTTQLPTDLSVGEKVFDIKIRCDKEFNTDKYIKIMAHSQQADELPKVKLAGLIKVCKNIHKIDRKQLKIVLVSVKTNKDNTTNTPYEIGKFEEGSFVNEVSNLKKVLYQNLIYANIERKELDLSDDMLFHENTTDGYIDSDGFIKAVVDPFNILDPFNNEINDVKQDYLKSKLGKKYEGCFTVFSFDIETKPKADGSVTVGNAQTIGKKSVCLYAGRGNFTMCHEALHGLGLFHAHANGPIDNPNQKYVFPLGNQISTPLEATDNMMSYNGDYRKSSRGMAAIKIDT
ncbi:MAG: hypothetical protein ACI7YS_07830 [Flavobacterium sp.]